MILSTGAPVIIPQQHAHKAPVGLRQLFSTAAMGNDRATAEAILGLIDSVKNDERIGHDMATRTDFARKIDAALSVFVQPDFSVPDDMWESFIRMNPIIANVLAGIGETTDRHIREVAGQDQEPFKSTVLYSPRNRDISIDFGMMLDANPLISSEWLYWTAKTLYTGNAERHCVEHFLRIIDGANEKLLPTHMCHEVYFLVSYLGSIEHERKIKGLINAGIQRSAVDLKIRNRPNPRKIAVFAEHWNKGHSVYRSLNAYIKALRPHFDEITLIHAVQDTAKLDVEGFDRVIRMKAAGVQIDPDPIVDNEWSAVIFADVGMTAPSVLMSNLRIAPVQVLLTGHPVSTFGGQMDWFVSGTETDTNPANYSERLCLLPGLGAVHERPTVFVNAPERMIDEEVIINASCYGQKVNYDWLDAMREAIESAGKPVRLRLFAGTAMFDHRGIGVFVDTITAALPKCHVELVQHLEYKAYMDKLAEGDFAVDCWPWGGSNVVSDYLHAGNPVVATHFGDSGRWFNQIGAAMVYRCDPFQPARNREEFIRYVRYFISDPHMRKVMRDRMQSNLDRVYDHSEAKHFADFIRNLASDPGYYKGDEALTLGGADCDEDEAK